MMERARTVKVKRVKTEKVRKERGRSQKANGLKAVAKEPVRASGPTAVEKVLEKAAVRVKVNPGKEEKGKQIIPNIKCPKPPKRKRR